MMDFVFKMMDCGRDQCSGTDVYELQCENCELFINDEKVCMKKTQKTRNGVSK